MSVLPIASFQQAGEEILTPMPSEEPLPRYILTPTYISLPKSDSIGPENVFYAAVRAESRKDEYGIYRMGYFTHQSSQFPRDSLTRVSKIGMYLRESEVEVFPLHIARRQLLALAGKLVTEGWRRSESEINRDMLLRFPEPLHFRPRSPDKLTA